MSKKSNFEIDLEIHKLEIEGIDKVLDIVKLIVSIGAPVCALLLSRGMANWWQWVAFGVLFGVVLGAFVELFNQTHKRNDILSEMKKKYLSEKSRPNSLLNYLARRKGQA